MTDFSLDAEEDDLAEVDTDEDGDGQHPGGAMSAEELAAVEAGFGSGSKRACLTTAPTTINRLLRRS